ncbi:hypoxanthine phosphoribosyltransferase [Trichloromonas sp.]|uniref:hypoxanthine phosphoribosyltransferase n=1 Tax=Trichloromonas sp. TaxID=3069249 RepID=UPI002A42F5C9|nr:hypoxanthine phosphoribosyltransferase [Trichloromonas sp.]
MSELDLKLLYSQEEIARQVQRLGDEISNDYPDSEILLVGVLKGSFLFVADLARAIHSPLIVDFVRIASYGSETQSSGIVEIRKDLELPIKNRDVIIVEDIVDSGHTLESLYNLLLRREPRSLKICTLIDKTGRREVSIHSDYVGFSLPDGFIVGYGLDYAERYRNLPDIHLVQGR